MYFRRNIDAELLRWAKESNKKPLLLRGARQVGKTCSIREFSKSFRYFLEVNFEKDSKVHSLFEGNLSPKEISRDLSVYYNVPVVPGETLVFFDEIQSCRNAISSLRFFHEQYPELHVVAAGSLLEFALSEIPSFGVGRIRSMSIYPFSFDEFLSAMGEEELLRVKNEASLITPLSDLLHEKLNKLLKEFLVLGGMPEVVMNYAVKRDINECQNVLNDLIISYKTDFAKYKKRVPPLRITEVFNSVSKQSGSKFVYSRTESKSDIQQIKTAAELLVMAGLVIPVTHSSSNGIPLGAEANLKKRKLLIFDTGILQRLLGLDIRNLLFQNDFDAINKGAIAEVFAGLEILKSMSCYEKNDLYFWQREAVSSSAEVDYVLQIKDKVIPVEVKSAKKGSMKSLYIFLDEKKSEYGVRLSMENFSSYKKVYVFPLYAAGNALSI